MRLLITRPQEDAEAIAALLKARGHTTIVTPLMAVRAYEGPELTLDGVQMILATSANGIRALKNRTRRRDIPVYAVGPQTAETAWDEGFAHVHSADGDAQALIAQVAADADPAKGIIWHAAGAETAGRMRQALQAHGFAFETAILYEAVPMTALPEAAERALREDALDGIMLFSPRSAKILAGLVADAALTESCARLDAFCISAATAAALAPLAFARIAVAGSPNQDAMLSLIPDAGAR